MIGSLCVAVLMIAAWLRPDPRGYGTHELLGIPPCGFLITSGLPCPTCGMTSSFALMVRGQLVKSVMVQPAGAMMCIGTMLLAVYGLIAAIQGRILSIQWDRIGPVRTALTIVFIFVAAWAIKLAAGVLKGEFPLR